MHQVFGILETPSVFLTGLLTLVVGVAMVLGYRRSHTTTAGSRLILVIGIVCLIWALVAILSAPLRSLSRAGPGPIATAAPIGIEAIRDPVGGGHVRR